MNNQIVLDLLTLGLDDWFHITDVIGVTLLHAGTDDVERINALSVEAVRAMLQKGLVTVGDLRGSEKDIKYEPWSLSLDATITRIAEELSKTRGFPGLSGEYWFSNTEKGDHEAGDSGG
jgi:hypothetical protein